MQIFYNLKGVYCSFEYIPIANDDSDLPGFTNAFLGNYPNPFNPKTNLRYSVKDHRTYVNISVYNIRGERVVTLVDEIMSVGEHNVIWKGTDKQGKQVASGVYFCRARIGETTTTSKMLLMK